MSPATALRAAAEKLLEAEDAWHWRATHPVPEEVLESELYAAHAAYEAVLFPHRNVKNQGAKS